MRRTVTVVSFCAMVLFLSASAPPPAQAACLATGKSCVVNGAFVDSLCCPGMVCGWGGVCQPGCRVALQFWRWGTRNPDNSCEVCLPYRSTTRWTNVCIVELFANEAEEETLLACMIDNGPEWDGASATGTSAIEATP